MRSVLLSALAAVLAVHGSAEAQTSAAATKPALSAEAMWGLKRLGDPVLTPDGRSAILSVSTWDVEKSKRSSDLWLYPVDGSAPRQLTTDPANEEEPQVSPDGRWVAFVAKRDADEADALYVLPLAGGEARRIAHVPTGVSSIRWLPNSSGLAFVTAVWPELTTWQAQGERLKARTEGKMTAKAWDKAPVSYWDSFIDDRQQHLYFVYLSGGDPEAITLRTGRPLHVRRPGPFPYDISPDGREVAYQQNVDPTGTDPNLDIVLAPAAGGPVRIITQQNRAADVEPKYSPDGKYIAWQQQRLPRFYADTWRLMLYERASERIRGLSERLDRSAEGLVWAPDSRGLYGSVDDRAVRRVYRFDVNGAAPRAITNGPDIAGLAAKGRSLVGMRQSFSEPPRLVRIGVGGDVTALSHENVQPLREAALGRVESVTYKGAEGADIQMWVTYPPGFDPAKKYPVFLLIHGGPHSGITDAWTWRWNAQVFAGWGYVVAWHNFHGSSGFGQAFTDSINPNWMDKPYADTIAAGEWFAAKPWVDAERMVAGGGSYGGYLSTVLLGREHPFKALIAHAAVYNQYTQLGGDWGGDQPRFPEYWERKEEFERFSPHMYAANFKTPTLVIHGQLDQRVPVGHGFELFQTLQRRGVPSRMVYYPDENHWVLKPQNSLNWYREVRTWLERYAPPGGR